MTLLGVSLIHLKSSSCTYRSMYPLEDECCHRVALLAPELETGCWQLLFKLKSWVVTQEWKKKQVKTCVLCKQPEHQHSLCTQRPQHTGEKNVEQGTINPPSVVLPGASRWQMRSHRPLAPCRLSSVTTLGWIAINESLLISAPVNCSIRAWQMTAMFAKPLPCSGSDNKRADV